MTHSALLSIENLSVKFGGVSALDGVDLTIGHGTIHGLIGPNGAGKTTLINVISRIVEPRAGRVLFDGANLLDVPAHQIMRMGIARTFQNLGLIEEASVIDNALVGVHTRHPASVVDEIALFWRRNTHERALRQEVRHLLDRIGLSALADVPVNSLAYGMRKNVELARALAAKPRLLMLDEPTAGLNDAEMDRLRELLLDVRREWALTVLVITHHVEFLVGLADVTTVLDLGRRIAVGTPVEVRSAPQVISAYIGTE